VRRRNAQALRFAVSRLHAQHFAEKLTGLRGRSVHQKPFRHLNEERSIAGGLFAQFEQLRHHGLLHVSALEQANQLPAGGDPVLLSVMCPVAIDGALVISNGGVDMALFSRNAGQQEIWLAAADIGAEEFGKIRGSALGPARTD
jgi:hypothetical protein